MEVIYQYDAAALDARPFVWIPEGTPLRPTPGAPPRGDAFALANAAVLDRSGEWLRVRYLGREVWVRQDEVEIPGEASLGREPEPVLPLAPSPPDPGRLEEALALFSGRHRPDALGPWIAYTDVTDFTVLEPCRRAAARLEELYRRRYGLALVGEAAEVVLLYRRALDYDRLRRREEVPVGTSGHASAARGLVALTAQGRTPAEVVSTLVHELTHLLNRRALGPALPPWLDEGIADDLAESRVEDDGTLRPGELGGEERAVGELVEIRGGRASLRLLRRRLAAERLELRAVLARSREDFMEPAQRPYRYAASSFLVRYLLSGDDPEWAERFRAFLDGVAGGGPATPEALLQLLETDWPTLEAGFAAWLEASA